jgi:hypothetical protein
MPRIELERLEEVDEQSQSSTESFDRIAFAERALALVRPPRTTVAICPGSRRVRVEAGRQGGGGRGERWAVLSVPVNASRRAIASAVLELGDGTKPRAWALDVLIGGCEAPYRAQRGPTGGAGQDP